MSPSPVSGQEEGSLSMKAGDSFLLVDPDWDGWSVVRRCGEGQEGLVSSVYLKILA